MNKNIMNKNKSLFLIDSPNIEHDFFQVHSNIANTLFDIINKHDVSKNSFTIGLFGEWGSGKSFIINKLSNKINEETSNITFINIDVWKYTGQPLLRSILFELDKQFKSLYERNKEKYKAFKDGYKDKKGKSLQDKLYYDEVFESESSLSAEEFKNQLKQFLRKNKKSIVLLVILFMIFVGFQFVPTTIIENSTILKILRPLLDGIAAFVSFIGGIGIFTWILQKPFKDIGNLIFFRNTVKNFTEKANFSPEQFERIFRDFLSKIMDEKYVIVFDNIDRCEPSLAYETLSTIKTYMDIKNCFYIIPIDDDAIRNYLANSTVKENQKGTFEREFTEEFIDKIFQTYIRIPILKEVERDRYIKKQLDKIDFQKELSNEDIETITQILYFAYKGESPRNIIRFINDYSSYFQLALRSFPKLLENITLFTIMIAIKQKWYHFEKILLDNPDFFQEYPSNKEILEKLEYNNIRELEEFLDNIQTYYFPSIKDDSFDEYVYFKESEKSIVISNALKNNQPAKIKLNIENIKILIKEFKKLISVKGQFCINAFNVLAKLIKESEEKKLTNKLVIEFWLAFVKTPKEQINLILANLLEDDILFELLNTLTKDNIKSRINITEIEDTFINYLKKPIKDNSEYEEYKEVFTILLSSDYKFNVDKIKQMFEEWKKENAYLNSLLQIISDKERAEYLPNNVLQQILVLPIDDNSITILQNWNHKTIPRDLGIKLFYIFLDRIKQRNSNSQYLTRQINYIEQDYKLILLIDISFIEDSKKAEFINSLSNFVNNIFHYANNQQVFWKLGVKFWIEAAYFSDLNVSLIDDKLFNIFNQYIKQNKTILDLMLNNIKYVENILSLPKTKRLIFNTSSDIQQKLYEKLNIKDSFIDFNLIISYPIEINHIEVLFSFLYEKKININNKKLSEYLLNKIIDELVNKKVDVSKKLNYLKNKFNLKPHRKLILENKNGIVDFCKEYPKHAYNLLSEFKSILPYSQFFDDILKPILNFLKAKLEQGEDIAEYNQLSHLLEITNNTQNNDLLYYITKKCLERNQSIKENYFGIDILKIIYSSLSKEQKEEVKKLVEINDHYNEWDNDYIDKLRDLSVIEDRKADEK